VPAAIVPKPVGARPDVGIETIVEEESGPKVGFYKAIEYIGYFFTILGLISAADLILQVFLRSTYNEVRWWVEVLLVTFGVLSYTIFGSIGRLGRQEEAKLAKVPLAPRSTDLTAQNEIAPPTPTVVTVEAMPPLTVNVTEFSRNSAGEFEKHLSGACYDVFRVDPDLVTVWREERRGMRSVYLAGPYELTKKMLQDQLSSSQEFTVGSLLLSKESVRGLLELMERSTGESMAANVSVPHGE